MSFDLTISKSGLMQGLSKAVSFIPNSTQGRQSVIYMKPQGGSMRIAVSYPDVTLSTLCNVRGEGTPDVVALYGRKFMDIVKQTRGDLRLTHEGAEFAIRCEGAKWVERPIKGSVAEIQFPGRILATLDSQVLADAIHAVQYVVSKDTTVPSYFALDIQDGRVRGSNGANYHEVTAPCPGLTFQVSNLHVDSFLKLLRLWSGPVEFGQNGANYYFRNQDDVLILRKLGAEFPDLDRSLLRPLRAQAQFLLKVRKLDMEEALRKVRISSSIKFPYVEIHMRQGEMIARCLGDDGVEAVARIEAVWNQAPRIATFNTNQLYDIVTNQTSEILEIRFAKDTKDRKSPILLEGENSWSLLTQLKMRARV